MTSATQSLRPDARAPGLLVGDDVDIADGVEFGAYVVIHDGVSIGTGVSIGSNVVIHPNTEIGSGCRIADNVVLGKPVYLSKSSTVAGRKLAGLTLGDDTTVGAGSVICAGTVIGPSSLVGDQVSIRERCVLGERVVVGRGSCVENDTTIGDRTKIQSNAYITAYMTLEDDVFIAPCVITTNDNFMGRTAERFKHRGGPTIRKGARIGGGAVLVPKVEIGEEAFVGAGAVVTRDVEARTVVVGVPAKAIRRVPDEELVANQ